jgi:dipeptidyl aminopeptidase/acylaminoacyl peptidase
MRIALSLFIILANISSLLAQKKPLDPSVYDGWQRIGERVLSANGKYLAYTVTPEEGDGSLFVRATAGTYAKEIPRGRDAVFTADGRFIVFFIRPHFKDMREARIKKKTAEQMPKDSLAWIDLATDSLTSVPRVKPFKVPDLRGDWLAYLLDKPEPPVGKAGKMDSLTRIRQLAARADSLARLVDSLRQQIREVGVKGWAALPATKKEGHGAAGTVEEGTELILLNLAGGERTSYPLTSEYYISRRGNTLVVETTARNSDSTSRAQVLWVGTATGIEYFTALRRLGKKAWLLEYNGEDHGLTERRNQKDWSQRMSQFFDYYLKGAPPARWITDGVQATLKGIDWGLETKPF